MKMLLLFSRTARLVHLRDRVWRRRSVPIFASRVVVVGITLLTASLHQALAITNTHSIEGYSDILSVGPTGTIKFSIHLPAGHSQYAVEILRFGEQGNGANAVGVNVAGPFIGTNGARRDFDEFNSYLEGAQWPVSFFLKVPSAHSTGIAPCTGATLPAATWKGGFYTAKITDSVSGDYFHITFILKDGARTRKSIALIASTNTWTAYNFWPGQAWGGASIYAACGGAARPKVTFLRPNPYATPETHDTVEGCPDRPYVRTEHLAAGELRVAHWLEDNNRPYSMLTDWDVHSIAGVLDPAVFRTVIISTHSEYWSPKMYAAVKQYLARGGNVISLSGNTVFWRITLAEANGNRTLQKNANWTPQEQAELLGLGSFGSSGVDNADCTAYNILRPRHWVFQNIPGQTSIGNVGVMLGTSTCLDGSHGASGWEVDRVDPSLHVFAREYAVLGESSNGAQHSNMIYMRRASAGQVLSVGSITAGQSLVVDGQFSAALLPVLDRFSQRSFSDFTSDGKPDLIARKPDGTLWRSNGSGSGALAPGVQFATAWSGLDQIVAPGDFDGDGKSDLIARGNTGKLWLYPGDGKGLLQTRLQIGTGWGAFNMIIAPGDFDGDGYPDLLARKPNGTLWLYRGTAAGSLITPAGPFETGWDVFDRIIAPGDFDEDGNPDLLARKPDGTLWLFNGVGDGTLAQNGGTQIDSQFNVFDKLITPGDFDGDHHADVLGRRPDGTLWLLNGVGDGTFVQNGGTQIDDGWNIFNTVVGVW